MIQHIIYDLQLMFAANVCNYWGNKYSWQVEISKMTLSIEHNKSPNRHSSNRNDYIKYVDLVDLCL